MPELTYEPAGGTLRAFMKSPAFVRGLRGPIGSGKSVCCCWELFRRALAQNADARDIRKTRFAIIRNTSPQLKTTTVKTWLDWFPEDIFGAFNWQPPYTHHVRNFGLDMEVIFLALDRPDDIGKLLSLELTGAWINEAREIPKDIVDAATSRVDRFPSMKDGGATWAGLIMDTNSPDDDHWWPMMSGEAPLPEWIDEDQALMLKRPDNWAFFTQPPGMIETFDGDGSLTGYRLNEAADNFTNLSPAYYPNLIRGKDRRWIDIYVLNRLGSTIDGKPIYRSFREEVHVARSPLAVLPRTPVHVGLDFGLTPAAVFAQSQFGRWFVQRELVAADMGATRFAAAVRAVLATVYPGCEYVITGDPAGDQRAQTDETTVFQVLRAAGLKAAPAFSNDFGLRVDAVETGLQRLVDGRPGILLDPAGCPVLVKACAAGYCYKRLAIAGHARYADRPDKNRYSHVAEAFQYLLMGGGEGRALLRPRAAVEAKVAARSHDTFSRLKVGSRGRGDR